MKVATTMNSGTQQLGANGGANGLSFLFSDFQLQRKEVEGMMKNIGTPILAAGEGIADPGVVHLFDSEEAFTQWAHRTRFSQKFDEITNIVHRARFGLPKELERSVRLVANTSIEKRYMSMNESSDTFTEGKAGASLYEHENFQGKSFKLGSAAIADLSDIEFFQSVSSIKVSGVCLLTDQVVFGGARLYLVGDPMLNITDLKAWGFNNCAASAIIL